MNILEDIYFNWMVNNIFFDESLKNTYLMLLRLLNSIPFEWSLEMDENRQKDAQDLRYIFGEENGYAESEICVQLDIIPPSLLEVIVALLIRVQNNILYDPDHFSTLNQEIFLDIISSLGLDHMTGCLSNENIRYFFDTIYRFYKRDYTYNGEGGLFTVKNPKDDMRNTEIWFQFMWYLDEKLGGVYL